MLHEGTPIRMRIARTISSADAHEGDRVDFQTLDDVNVGNVVVIPKNSTCLGTITVAESKKRMARGGKLGLNIDFVRLPSGEKLALRGVQNLKGGGHTGAMTGGIVAAAIVLWPAAPFFLFMHGKDVTIPEGHEVTVYTNSELKLDPSKIATVSAPAVTAGAAAAKTSEPTLTNPDIVKLKSLGLSDELIVQKINMSPGNYKLEVDDLETDTVWFIQCGNWCDDACAAAVVCLIMACAMVCGAS